MENKQKDIAFLWSTATQAAICIQKHWKRHRAQKVFKVMLRRHYLAKRAASIKNHMQNKWRWEDAIQRALPTAKLVCRSFLSHSASFTRPSCPYLPPRKGAHDKKECLIKKYA
jgi:hypothetical protein